eukprot:416657-Amphidinium_carterae.1
MCTSRMRKRDDLQLAMHAREQKLPSSSALRTWADGAFNFLKCGLLKTDCLFREDLHRQTLEEVTVSTTKIATMILGLKHA